MFKRQMKLRSLELAAAIPRIVTRRMIWTGNRKLESIFKSSSTYGRQEAMMEHRAWSMEHGAWSEEFR